ncbi:hypothetical protein BGZ82_006290 [Podila clonocystis]|nr:hypothetical protein BGZ82_006290 [Podila clonocystis]
MSSPSFPITEFPVELQFFILKYFSLRDLVRCVLVNKAHHALCTPRIWRVARITHLAVFRKFQSPIVKEAFITHAPFIQELYTGFDQVIRWIVQPLVSSLTAELPPPDTRSMNFISKNLVRLHVHTVDQSLVLPLIKNNLGLRTLIWSTTGKIQDGFLSDATAYLPVLEELELVAWTHAIPAEVLKRFLEDLPETVRKISLQVNVIRQLKNSSTDLIACRSHPWLESIKIKGDMGGEDEYIFARFLGSCSMRLKRVALPRYAQLQVSSLFDILERLEAVPDTFCWTTPIGGTGDELTDFDCSRMIARSSKWKRIDIRGQREVGSLTAAAITSHCGELETLTLSDCPKVNGAPIQRILSAAPNLLHVDFVGLALFEDDQFQLTCLELSLASGLDRLAALKELQVLNVSRMAHRIGVSPRS